MSLAPQPWSAPRPPPPRPHQLHLLPPTAPGPLVPDPSLYMPGQSSFPTYSPAPSPLPPPPRPHLPSHHLLRPQSDFSRVFQHTEATVFLQGSDAGQFSLTERRVQFTADTRDHGRAPARMEFPHPTQLLPTPLSRAQQPQDTTRQPPQSYQPLATSAESYQPLPSSTQDYQPLQTPTESYQRLPTSNPSLPALEHPATPRTSKPLLGPYDSPTPSLPLALSSSPPPHLPALPSDSPLHPDLLQVLAWQNDQLRRLQGQVSALLAASPPPRTATPPASPGPALLPSSSSTATATTPSRATISTNTSLAWPDIQRGLARLRGEDPGTPSSTSQPSLAPLDLPEYRGSPGEHRGSTASWSSPVLGESVSMYEEERRAGEEEEEEEREEEDVAELYHNILGQVKRLLNQEEDSPSPPAPPLGPLPAPSPAPPHLAPSPAPPSSSPAPPSSSPAPPDPRAAMLDRLRQMGVSFISPADLAPSTPSLPYNSVYLPRAALPSQSVFQGASPDGSLAVSSLALKYLDDAQLSRLAATHGAQAAAKVPANDVSLATHQFLARHGLDPGHRPATNQQQPATNQQYPATNQQYPATNQQQPATNQQLLATNQQYPATPEPYPAFSQLAGSNLAQPYHPGHQPYQAPPSQPQPFDHQRFEPPSHPLEGPHPQMAPQPAPQPAPQGPHLQMGAPRTLVDRVLDITAIRQQPKLL